jgi:tetratricopeptide (TPR) repeat protein
VKNNSKQLGVLAVHDGDHKTAIKHYSDALATEKSVDLLRERAKSYAALKKLDSAIKDYTTAINIQLDNSALYCERAELYIKKADYNAGLEDCNDALEINPRCPIALLLKGLILVKLGSINDGMSCINNCLQINKWYARAYYERAILMEGIDKEKAKFDYYQAAHIGYPNALKRYRILAGTN